MRSCDDLLQPGRIGKMEVLFADGVRRLIFNRRT